MIYTKSHLKTKEIKNIVIDPNLWLSAIEVLLGDRKYIIACLYHSPSSSDAQFIEALEDILPELLIKACNFILIGDFNINMALDTYYSKKLKTTLKELGVYQQMDKFTRITGEGASIIDLLVTSFKDIDFETRLTPKITDHVIITLELCKKTRYETEEKTIHDYSRFNELEYQLNLMDKKWNSELPLEETSQLLVDNISNAINQHAPLKKIKIKQQWGNKQWWTDEIGEEIKQRDMYYKKAVITQNREDWDQYRHKRNLIVNKIRILKQQYYLEKIDEAKNDSKEMWKVIKEITSDDARYKLKNGIEFDGKLLSEPSTVAENFNTYFINSVTEITSNLPCNETTYMEVISKMNQVRCGIRDFKPVEFSYLKSTVKNLQNKNSSIDGINSKILKLSFEAIGHQFLEVINRSIVTGKFPDTWKTTTVTPIPKKRNSNLCQDFRPINMVPLYEKLLETSVKTQLIQYIEENGLLTTYQAGFRKNNSCETALQNVLANWKSALQENLFIGAVFLDFRRAFETISRPLLLKKLERLGLTGNALGWIESYLQNRTQITRYNNAESSSREITLGVPQGTVMGPDLFILYINDIVKWTKNCKIQLFADDTLLYLVGNDVQRLIKTINEELKLISRWLQYNNLKLNIEKTKFMIVRNRGTVQEDLHRGVEIDGIQIEKVTEFKYLGVIIDQHLSFTNHATYVTGKIAKKVYALGRLRNTLSVWSKTLIYKSIIQPHMYYCPTVLFTLNNSEIAQIQKRQNMALRVILNCNRRTNVRTMLQAVGVLSVKQTIYLQSLIFIFKIVQGSLPENLQDFCIPVRSVHDRNTRNADNFYIPAVRRNFDQRNIFHNGLKAYNELPNDIKHSPTLNEFKRRCRLYIEDRIPV